VVVEALAQLIAAEWTKRGKVSRQKRKRGATFVRNLTLPSALEGMCLMLGETWKGGKRIIGGERLFQVELLAKEPIDTRKPLHQGHVRAKGGDEI